MDEIRKAFRELEPKVLDAAIVAAGKKVKAAKHEKKTRTKGGRYNGIPLSFVPYFIISVADAGKPDLTWTLVGQTVVAIGRNFVAPVVIEYVTVAEHQKWVDAMIAAVQTEVNK